MYYPLTKWKMILKVIFQWIGQVAMVISKCWESWNGDLLACLLYKSCKRAENAAKQISMHTFIHAQKPAIWDKGPSKVSTDVKTHTLGSFNRTTAELRVWFVLGPVYIIFSATVTIEPPEIRHVNTKCKHQCTDYQHKNTDASHKAPTLFKEQVCWSPIAYSVIR